MPDDPWWWLPVGLALMVVGAAILGGYVVLAIQGVVLAAAGVEPADVFDDDPEDDEDCDDQDSEGPGSSGFADGETLRLVMPRLMPVPCQGGRHRPEEAVPVDDRVRLAPFVLRPDRYPTVEYPPLAPRSRERALWTLDGVR